MSDNKRDSNRFGLVVDIKIICEDKTEYILKTRNISDKGVFIDYDASPLSLTIGTHVTLQVSSQLGDETPPPVHAEVIRTTDEGMGLRFLLQ